MALGNINITKLNNSNCHTWKFTVELLMIKDDLWEAVIQPPPDPVTTK